MKNIIDSRRILRSDSHTLPDSDFGISVLIDHKGIVIHAGIFIRYNVTNYLFHYTGEKVILELIPENCLILFKRINLINMSFIPSIFSHFKKIESKAKPQYGYYYNGSLYDSNEDFVDEGKNPEYMSCVGFCLNVLKNILLGKDVLKYKDWTSSNSVKDEYILSFFTNKVLPFYPQLILEDFAKGIRRIRPIEYFTAGFGLTLPVEKSFTDEHRGKVETAVVRKYN